MVGQFPSFWKIHLRDTQLRYNDLQINSMGNGRGSRWTGDRIRPFSSTCLHPEIRHRILEYGNMNICMPFHYKFIYMYISIGHNPIGQHVHSIRG